MKREFKHLRRQLCRWIVGFDDCPSTYRKNYATIIVKALSISMLSFGIICAFLLLAIFL